mgnify:CR=1 FL=1
MSENEEKNLHENQEQSDAQPSIDNETLRILATLVKELVCDREQGSLKTYFWGTIIGIIVGAVFCIAGFIITIMGLTGSIEWIFQAGDFTSKLANAGPGVFFALLGMFILWRYKPKQKEKLTIGPLEHLLVYKYKQRKTKNSETRQNGASLSSLLKKAIKD